MLFFSNMGKMYRLKVHELPEASRQAKGSAIVNLLPLDPGEKINTVIPVKGFLKDQCLLFVTRKGVVKKTLLSDYESRMKGGLIAIDLREGDELIGVRLTEGDDDVIMVTQQGQAIRFSENEVRCMGRGASGVRGITLNAGDIVIGMDTVKEDAELLILTNKGFGKRTMLKEYKNQSRGGKGIKTMKLTQRNGLVVSVKVVKKGSELMLMSAEGHVLRIGVEDIPSTGRNTQGVTVMRVVEGDVLMSAATIMSKQDEN
jgi:DNA gyrase subunit A